MRRPSQMRNSDRCESHLDHTRWSRTPVPDRDGWELARCVDCGVFIGMNPIPDTTEAEKQAKIQEKAAEALRNEFDWGSSDGEE